MDTMEQESEVIEVIKEDLLSIIYRTRINDFSDYRSLSVVFCGICRG